MISVHNAGSPSNVFTPNTTFGAGVDGREHGDASRTFTPRNVEWMRSAGFSLLTYRLRTELGIEAWHWNPIGVWSDRARKRGYWTSDVSATELSDSYGYRLPRRGSTVDQANNDGYSRIDDGDLRTFWKSNPYLDEAFTHDPAGSHPQWAVVDFGTDVPINAIRIRWRKPYATKFRIDYCGGRNSEDFADQVPQCWQPFPVSQFMNKTPAAHLLRVSAKPIQVRFLRIVLEASCRCSDRRTGDLRDRLGYAIYELEAGAVGQNGRFQDWIRHAKDNRRQSVIVTSSTDPWHTAADIDWRTEQPGVGRVLKSSITNSRLLLMPVGVLYDTPANAAAEVMYLLAQGYPIEYVEIGEEPDGQYATPEDYGALFLQVADAIHAVSPNLRIGGPSFQTSVGEYFTMPLQREDRRTWLRRFLDYLRERARLSEFSFLSFEWYPFDDGCGQTRDQLAIHPELLAQVVHRFQRDGLPRGVPWFVSEYGYSAFACRPEVDIVGALLNAETVGEVITLGAARAYLYGFEPSSIADELSCGSWGNNALFLAGPDGQTTSVTATYWAARLINERWVVPGDEPHAVYPASGDVFDADGRPMITAFAVHRPDERWALLIINKAAEKSYRACVRFDVPVDAIDPSTMHIYTYSREQYQWMPAGKHGHAVVNDPPKYTEAPGSDSVALPPYSVSVVIFE